jgi:2-polyprenyl-6-methoxyphenol hydroxylase-like FAD-dependent oxidoreductase
VRSVLIVGAGPTGLTLGVDLARRGVPVRIVDKSPEPFAGSRGKGLQPRSQEVLDDLGVIGPIRAAGTAHLVHRYYQRDRVIREADPAADAVPTPAVPYESALTIPQWRVEQILRDRLADFGVAVELGTELVDLDQDGTAVTAVLAGARGTERVEVAYLAGCDGGRSRVRKLLGVGFQGETRADAAMILGDVEVDGLREDRWHFWIDAERGMLALCPFVGTRSWQLQAGLPPDEHGRLPEPTLDTFRRVFADFAGLPGVRLSRPTWTSTYRANVRMVDRFRVGRVFLAGDAAHVHSLVGGLGMNTGIQDAYNLGWKLAAVLAGADAGLLDSYQEERLPIAQWLLATSNQLGQAFAEAVQAGGGLDTAITPETRQLGLGYRWSSLSRDLDPDTGAADRVRAGDRAPDAPCRHPVTGDPVRLFDVFRGPHFTLLGFGAGTAGAIRSAAARRPDLGRACLLAEPPAPGDPRLDGDTLLDADGHARRAYRAADGTLVLIRPDGYLAMTAPAGDVRQVLNYLHHLPGGRSCGSDDAATWPAVGDR